MRIAVRLLLSLAAALPILASGCQRKSEEPPAATAEASPVTEDTATVEPSPPPTEAPATVPADFTAVGTEPFWSARVRGSKLTYMTPDFPEGETIPVTIQREGGSVTYSGDVDGKPLELTVTAGACSDGMSDQKYRWSVTRTIGPDEQKGCARVP